MQEEVVNTMLIELREFIIEEKNVGIKIIKYFLI